MADWLEASLIFFDGQISKSDVVDVLIEEQICPSDNQDIAHEIADMGWSELELRHQQSGGGIKDVRYAGLHGQIIVFDRLRLMSALLTEGLTLSDELRTELVEWIENLIPTLPQMS